MSARDPAERIAAALEAIAHSLAVGVERTRPRTKQAAAKPAKRQHRPALPAVPVDDLAAKRAAQALRRLGL